MLIDMVNARIEFNCIHVYTQRVISLPQLVWQKKMMENTIWLLKAWKTLRNKVFVCVCMYLYMCAHNANEVNQRGAACTIMMYRIAGNFTGANFCKNATRGSWRNFHSSYFTEKALCRVVPTGLLKLSVVFIYFHGRWMIRENTKLCMMWKFPLYGANTP